VVNAHVLPWSGRLEGLDADATEMPLWGGRLADCAADALSRAGFTVGDWSPGEEALIVAGGAALRPEAARAALELGRARGQDLRLTLGGRAGELLSSIALGQAPEALWYLAPGGAEGLQGRLEAAAPARIDPEERLFPLPFPGERMEIALTDRLALPVRHWVELLWANLLGLAPHLWGAILGRPLPVAALRVAWGSLKAMSARPEYIAAALSRRGRGVAVHPSAVVEACVLGAGVRVGAGAVVRGCVLGEGAEVEPLAICEASVLGPGAVVQRQGMVKFSALGPGAVVGGVAQLAVLGARAAIKRGAFGLDQGLRQGVRVPVGGRLAPAPLGVLGVALGEGSLLGSGVWLAPGRSLPAGVAAVAAEIISDPATEGPGPHRVVDGKLEPL